MGVNRQAAGVSGEMQSWYRRTSPTNGAMAMRLEIVDNLLKNSLDSIFDSVVIVNGLA